MIPTPEAPPHFLPGSAPQQTNSEIEWSVRTAAVRLSARLPIVHAGNAPILNELLLSYAVSGRVQATTRRTRQTALTPGSVFCSCKVFCAAMALSRWQYVRKAQPVNTPHIRFYIY